MKHPSIFGFITLSIILLLTLALDAETGDLNDYLWAKPGDNVEAGQIYIQVTKEAAPLNIIIYNDITMTGIPSLDAVADAFGVYDIKKTYQMDKTPKDPSTPDLSRYYTVYFPAEFGPFQLIDAYESCNEVVFAEFVSINYHCYIPNDTRFRNQWHLSHCGLPGAWDVSHGSEEIVIGIVDGGLDMDAGDPGYLEIHEDFAENLWHNPGEDLNNDGICDWENDLNDEDDDENGYVDDFHGWDFSGNDNWPDDYWGEDGGHGTHVAGIASAVTDNETGISGAGFNCRLMISAHYSRDVPSRNVAGYRGIEYCAANGAKVINCSYGGLHAPIRTEEAAVEFAHSQGSIIFAGAGNDNQNDRRNDNQHFYPFAYDGVIGVGACDDRDRKANFSNYGDFLDLVAPGVAILSAWPRNSYANAQGTSMSSPFAAGMGALALSVRPDLNATELLQWMQRTAVDISQIGDNDQYNGIVYRVDADFLLNSTHPKYEIISWDIIEVEGDQDGHIDQDEVISIPMIIANLEGYEDANNVTITLENNDGYIEILTEAISIGDIEAGNELEIWEDDYPSFRVRSNSSIHYTVFRLIMDSDENYTQTFELRMTIRHPRFLLVDDDNGGRMDEFLEDDLMQRPIVHDLWRVETEGLPSLDELSGYSFVIWETGNDENPLTADEQNLIGGFLDNGGYLLLSGQYIGDAHGNTEFHRNYLKANHLNDDARNYRLSGVANNPMTDGFDMLLVGGGGAGNGRDSPSTMEPIDGATTILHYTNDDEDAAGIYYAGDYHLVYLGFALEAVSTTPHTTSRLEFLESVLDYFSMLDAPDETPIFQPASIQMAEPRPNPFNGRTSVRVDVPYGAGFRLEVLDINGRHVATIHEGFLSSGSHTYTWDGKETPAGVYLFNLTWSEGALTRKVVLVK